MEDMTLFQSDVDGNLDSVLSLSPPPDPDDYNTPLFQDLTAFLNASSDISSKSSVSTRNSSVSGYSSDSDIDIIDVDEKQDETVFNITENSPGEDELISYLTESSVDKDIATRPKDIPEKAFKPVISIWSKVNMNNNNQVSKYNTLETDRNKPALLVGTAHSHIVKPKPILVSGNHKVVTIPKNGIRMLNTVRVIRKDGVTVKVGGGPSFHLPDEEFGQKSLSKSAVAARENREKKKKYVEELERNVKTFGAENKTLKQQVSDYEKEVHSLSHEVAYLKSVLANQSTLSALLKNIPGIKSVRLTTSKESFVGKIGSRKRSSDDSVDEKENDNLAGEVACEETTTGSSQRKRQTLEDHEYASNTVFGNFSGSRKKKATQARRLSGGVCLHVSGGEASLEFCAHCSLKASTEPS